MSTKRIDEDDDGDIDVELDSNDSNMAVDIVSATPSESILRVPLSGDKDIHMDVTVIATLSDGRMGDGGASDLSTVTSSTTLANSSNSNQEHPAVKKEKSDLDHELESKYSQIWGELKVRFTNRHFLRSGMAYLQAQSELASSSNDEPDEVTVGGVTFFRSDTHMLDIFLGMTPEPEV